TESPERALVARLAGTHQGSGFGLYHGITGFAALVGGVALGGVFQRYGAAPAFLASAAGGLALVFAWPVFAGGWRRGVRGSTCGLEPRTCDSWRTPLPRGPSGLATRGTARRVAACAG